MVQNLQQGLNKRLEGAINKGDDEVRGRQRGRQRGGGEKQLRGERTSKVKTAEGRERELNERMN